MVRCPACKSVFSAASSVVPAASQEELDDREEIEERPRTKRGRAAQSADRQTPRKKPARRAVDEEAKTQPVNRDFDPPDPEERSRKPRRSHVDDGLDPDERAALKQAFDRAAWGGKLIWISILLFMLSMILIIGFWFETAFGSASPVLLVLAGLIGLLNWLLALIGVSLCLSGPPSPGHWGYGISALVVTALHLMMLLLLAGHGKEYSAGRATDAPVVSGSERWALVPTRLDTLILYLTFLVYPNQGLIPRGSIGLSIVVGVVEVVRIVLIMMLLSCLARAAGDEELSHDCTRAGGIASFGPGILSVLMLLYVMAVIETNAQSGELARIVFSTVQMGIYAILIGTMLRALMVTREVAEACEEPFQSQLPKY
jgi:hypothetical protein